MLELVIPFDVILTDKILMNELVILLKTLDVLFRKPKPKIFEVLGCGEPTYKLRIEIHLKLEVQTEVEGVMDKTCELARCVIPKALPGMNVAYTIKGFHLLYVIVFRNRLKVNSRTQCY